MNYVTVIMTGLCMILANGFPEQTEQILPMPYTFSYTAGRMPGHVDRVHSETSDGHGNIRGMFSYVDPRQQIRTVEYVANQNGFQPLLITNPTQDTTAVRNAKIKHNDLFNQIAADHQRVSSEQYNNKQNEDEQYDVSEGFDPNLLINQHPQDTPVVEKAKLRHYDLYNRIALEHAKIAAERGQYEEQEEQESQQGKIVKIGF